MTHVTAIDVAHRAGYWLLNEADTLSCYCIAPDLAWPDQAPDLSTRAQLVVVAGTEPRTIRSGRWDVRDDDRCLAAAEDGGRSFALDLTSGVEVELPAADEWHWLD
jgi:hypothetical protein